MEDGIQTDSLTPGTLLEVATRSRSYRVEILPGGEALISGHPKYCPEPTCVRLHGSTWGHSLLRLHYIGKGMNLEFGHPQFGIVHTSPVLDVREVAPNLAA
ncbi:MAG: hypothetical protein HYR60_07310 [Acidobacteria bacterium]|nr:hypothetical protein [Acidobacteriota bacterium]MBI3472090.1 hypothetical protein [Candidatus Solibacter usitatus]